MRMFALARRIIYRGAFFTIFDCPHEILTSNRTILADKPNIIVATPTRALSLLQSKVRT